VKWASGLSTSRQLDQAVDEITGPLVEALERVEPDLVLAFAAGHDAAELARLPGLLHPWLGDGLLVGCNGSGVIAAGREEEEGPALALLAGILGDVQLTAAHVEQHALPPVAAARESWWQLLGVRPEAEPSFMVLADPYSFDVEHCVRGLDRAFPGATVVGGLTSAVSQPGQACLLAGRDLHRAGGLLLVWSGNVALDGIVSQGCRPVGEPLFVTSSGDSRIRELDGKLPREVLRELFATLDETDRELFNSRQLLIGLALPGPRQAVGPGDFLVREVIGLDADSGELVVGGRAAEHMVVQFHLRDADAAAADLERQLKRYLGRGLEAPAAALMFACVGRGTSLYGVPGRDLGLFRRGFGDLPVAGLFCAGELGPVQAATFLHAYSAVFGLIRPRQV
jgi:small ligand-binding sensory domain FIST